MSVEIGGGNGVQPLMAAAHHGLPVVDADTMGRAYPEAQMTSVAVGGLAPYPCALYDPRGIEAIVHQGAELEMDGAGRPQDLRRDGLDRLDLQSRRAPARRSRNGASTSPRPRRSASAAAVRDAQRLHDDPIAAILDVEPAASCCSAARSSTSRGGPPRAFCAAVLRIDGLDEDRGARLSIAFQNEWIVAWRDGEAHRDVARPDLRARHGIGRRGRHRDDPLRQRVTVIALPAPPVFLTPKGLEHVGPRAFGYDLDFRRCSRSAVFGRS